MGKKEKKASVPIVAAILGVFAGLIFMAGALYSYVNFEVDGLISIVFAASGGYLIWYVIEILINYEEGE